MIEPIRVPRSNDHGDRIDIYPKLRKTLRFCEAFLSSPYTIDEDRNLEVSTWKSWVQFVLWMGLIASKLLLEIVSPGISIRRNPYSALGVIRSFCRVVYSFVVGIECKRHHEKLRKIFQKVKELDNAVRLTKRQERNFTKQLAVWVAATTGIVLLLFASGFAETKYTAYTLIPILTYFIMLLLAPIVGETLLWVLLLLCGFYNEYVNDELKRSFDRFGPGKVDAARRIRSLRKLFGRVYKLRNDINAVYSRRIWLCILQLFVELIFFVFVNIVLMKYWTDFSNHRIWAFFVIGNVWIMFQIFKLFQLVSVCDKVVETGRKISATVHESLAETSEEAVRQELAIFSLDLLHKGNDVTASGFFSVNYRLISSVASGVMMHIIILLQFNFPGYEGDIRPIEDIFSRM